MGDYTLGKKAVSGADAKLVEKLLRNADPKLHNGDKDISAEEAVALMGQFCRDDAQSMNAQEATHLARLFQQRFPKDFNADQCPRLFASPQTEMKSRAREVIELVAGRENFQRVRMTRAVYNELQSSFQRDSETGFAVFADAKTGCINKVVHLQDGSKRSISVPSQQLNALKMKLEKQGEILVGFYHSHVFTAEEARKWREEHQKSEPAYQQFDESLLSAADGSAGDGAEKMDQVQLLGSSADEKGFRIRAFLILPPYILKKIDLNPEGLDASRFVRHYNKKVGPNEIYELDVTVED